MPASPSLYLTKYLYTYNELIFSRFGPSNPAPKSKISCINKIYKKFNFQKDIWNPPRSLYFFFSDRTLYVLILLLHTYTQSREYGKHRLELLLLLVHIEREKSRPGFLSCYICTMYDTTRSSSLETSSSWTRSFLQCMAQSQDVNRKCKHSVPRKSTIYMQ